MKYEYLVYFWNENEDINWLPFCVCKTQDEAEKVKDKIEELIKYHANNEHTYINVLCSVSDAFGPLYDENEMVIVYSILDGNNVDVFCLPSLQMRGEDNE